MPRQKRNAIFGRGELTRAILSELCDSDQPLSSREIAQSLIALRGEDSRDRKYLSDIVSASRRRYVSSVKTETCGR
jgi:repressor of nif and glnA expression